MKIGNVALENNVFLAPMAGVTDLPFRILCKEMGCGLVYSEMVSAKGILYDNKNTTELLEVDPKERPVAVQLFGSDPEILGAMAKKIEEYPIDIIDVNMGCPAPKIVKNGEGSCLMKTPELVGKIVRSLVESQKKPVTIKFRKGFDEEHINAVEIAKIAEANGASAVAVHGRTREQYYSGKADWDIILSLIHISFFFERKRRGIMAKKILAAANNKEQKYFMEEEFKFLPDTIKEDLKRICVYMAEKLNCTFLVGFDDNGDVRCV